MCKGIKDLFSVIYRNHLPHLPPFWGFRTLRGQIPWHLLCFRDYAYQGRFWLSDICWCLVFFFFRTPIASGITGSVLLIIFRSLISLCFITCLIRISFNLKKDQKNPMIYLPPLCRLLWHKVEVSWTWKMSINCIFYVRDSLNSIKTNTIFVFSLWKWYSFYYLCSVIKQKRWEHIKLLRSSNFLRQMDGSL